MADSIHWVFIGFGLAIAGVGVSCLTQALILLRPQSTDKVGRFLKHFGIAWIIIGLIPLLTGTIFLICHFMRKLMA